MKFTIALADLKSLLKGAGISRPRKTDVFTLSACVARVFVESKNGIFGIEALGGPDGVKSKCLNISVERISAARAEAGVSRNLDLTSSDHSEM
jgi:hypothetical protein